VRGCLDRRFPAPAPRRRTFVGWWISSDIGNGIFTTAGGRKPKLTPQQITHARKLIDDGQRREEVAALLTVDRTTLYRR
jgi:hypothetical protein